MRHRRRGALVGAGIGALALALATASLTGGSRADGPSGVGAPEPTASASPDAGAAADEPTGPPVLDPNLRSIEAYDLQVEVVGEQRRLRFAAALANTGAGPLVLRPNRDSARCPRGQLSATQTVHLDADGDGRFTRDVDRTRTRRFAGCMLDHPGHDHWHFDAMAAYSLRRPGAQEPLVSRDKVSFCLRDNERVEGVPTTVRREYYGECSATTVQGISPGWVDVYIAELDGQWLAVPPQVRRGVLCLDLEADPLDLVRETDETDNGTSVAVRIDGTSVRRAAAATCA